MRGTYDCSHPRHAIDRDVEEAKDTQQAERVHVVLPARDPHRRERDGVGHVELVRRRAAEEEGQGRDHEQERADHVHVVGHLLLHVREVRLLELRILELEAEGALEVRSALPPEESDDDGRVDEPPGKAPFPRLCWADPAILHRLLRSRTTLSGFV